MLIQRVITALLLLPPLLALVWFGSTLLLYSLLSVAVLGVAWEWAALAGLASRGSRAGYVALTAAALAAAWLLRDHWLWFAGVAALWWLAALYVLPGFPENFRQRPPLRWQMGVLGQILLLPTLLCLAQLHAMPDGALRVLYVLFLVFAADVGAYLAGRNLGRHKLAPEISPGKTVEGALGGFGLCALWALTAGSYVFAVDTGTELAMVLALSLLVAAVSIVGDLTESMFKRLAGVKDSGALLPGHGGLLDRVDSILAAVPVMALGVYVLGL
jgi:phosphatidate cytidylyltransferase